MLNETQLLKYRQDGQITVPEKLDDSSVERARCKMEGLFESRPELGTDHVPHLIEIDDSWLEFACSPTILDNVEQLIGPDIIVWGSAFFCKKPVGGKATPWRQDSHTWPIRPLQRLRCGSPLIQRPWRTAACV